MSKAHMKATCFVRGTSLALLCLLTPASFGQTKRSKSDSDIDAIGHRTIAHGQNFYSPEHEKELGAKLALETEKSNRMIESPWIQAYVDRVAQRVEGNSDKHIPLTIRLIDSETVEAFTLPGGYQYITRGLLLRLNTEGALAAVLARGTARTALRSDTTIATESQITRMATKPLVKSPNQDGSLNFDASDLVELKRRRDAELDADYFGAQYLYKSGYDPACLIDLLQALGEPGVAVTEVFRKFPPLSVRLNALRKEIAEILPPRSSAVISTQDFEQFKAQLHALKAEDDTLSPII
jgi:predicted Zn-dependent protease